MKTSDNWFATRFELSRGGADNLRAMEGLRGFAVFLTFLVHYSTAVAPWLPDRSAVKSLAEALHDAGGAGVELFFVLSGYLIYGALLRRPQPFLGFMARRVRRIYPAFIAVFLIYLALSLALPQQSKLPHDHWAAMLYLAENFLLLPGLFPIEPMITVAWSLSYEIFYYLALPSVVAVFALRQRTARWRGGFVLAIAVLFGSACGILGGPIALIMFMAGMLLYETINARLMPAPSGAIAAVALGLGLFSMTWPAESSAAHATRMAVLFAALFLFCLTCFTRPAATVTKVCRWTPLRWFGNMSYSYYLLHGLTLNALFSVVGALYPSTHKSALIYPLLLPLAFLCSLVPCVALFLSIERRFSLTEKRGPASEAGSLPVAKRRPLGVSPKLKESLPNGS